MGVDFKICKNCNDTFPDCGYYVYCEGCGNKWCSDECAEADGYRVDVDNKEEYSTSCNYCREEDFSDSELLRFALQLAETSRSELIEMYKQTKSQ